MGLEMYILIVAKFTELDILRGNNTINIVLRNLRGPAAGVCAGDRKQPSHGLTLRAAYMVGQSSPARPGKLDGVRLSGNRKGIG